MVTKSNGYYTFEPVIDTWSARSDENIKSGAILSLCVDLLVIIMLQKN